MSLVATENKSYENMLGIIKDAIGEVSSARFTSSLGNHPVCLTTEGDISSEMEKVLKKMPGANGQIPGANMILEINLDHPIKDKLVHLYESDREKLKSYAKLLYAQGRLIGGMSIDNPKELCGLISELMI